MVGVSALEVSHFPPSLFFLSGFFWREAASAEHRQAPTFCSTECLEAGGWLGSARVLEEGDPWVFFPWIQMTVQRIRHWICILLDEHRKCIQLFFQDIYKEKATYNTIIILMWISGKFIIQVHGTGSGLCLLSVLKHSGSEILNVWSLPSESQLSKYIQTDKQINRKTSVIQSAFTERCNKLNYIKSNASI